MQDWHDNGKDDTQIIVSDNNSDICIHHPTASYHREDVDDDTINSQQQYTQLDSREYDSLIRRCLLRDQQHVEQVWSRMGIVVCGIGTR